MKVIYGVRHIPKFIRPVVAIGVFDGVHAGHQEIVRAVIRKARRIHGTSVVLTFWPHPQGKPSLYSLEHRLKLFSEAGVKACVVVCFSRHFARMSASDFITHVLLSKVHAHYLYVGENFRFGKNAQGTPSLLRDAAKINKFKVKVFKVREINGREVSSTYIRGLIKKGDLARAQKFLGRPVSILGRVIRGISLGKKLGYPTANIDPHHEIIPAQGVYAVRVIVGSKKFNGACYIGPRARYISTFSSSGNRLKSAKKEKGEIENIEVNIFNFKRTIYGKSIEVQFVKKIRSPKVFDSFFPLIAQIKQDIAFIKRLSSLH